MSGVAVAIVGVPEPALKRVRLETAQQFPNGYVFRSKAAPNSASRLTVYNEAEVEAALTTAVDSVFGHTKRPLGFCRNPQRPCALKTKGRHTCGKSENAACDLARPEFIVCFYQAGVGQKKLKEALYHSAYLIEIPQDIYGLPDPAAQFVITELRRASKRLSALRAEYTSSACPLLLPPKNFGVGKVVNKLLARVESGADVRAEVSAFRRQWFRRSDKKFLGRSGLGFAPAQGGGQHGTAADIAEMSLALSRHYRLGCAFSSKFHWDVRPANGNELAGNFVFYCRSAGEQKPQGTHANVLVDDCLR